MGDISQLIFVKKFIDKIDGSILEVGSKDYGNTQNLRPLFKDKDYIGIDMEEGPGVDVIVDLTEESELIRKKLGNKKFKTIFCFCVLEHCCDPFKVAMNLENLLDKNGVIFMSVPFSWRIHGYPNDFWRFTPEGIKILFPNLKFDMKYASLTSSNPGKFHPIDDYMLRIELDVSKLKKRKIYSNFKILIIRILRKIKIIPFITIHPYLFPPVNVNMIGIKQ